MKIRSSQVNDEKMRELILYLATKSERDSRFEEEIEFCRLPDSFFEVLGTWEDDREPEEILRDLRR